MPEIPAIPADRPASPLTYAWCGLRVALVGCVLISVVECAAAASVALHGYGDTAIPWSVLVAATGKSIASHIPMWCPLTIVVGLLFGWLLRRRALHAPEAVMTAWFVLLAGWLVALVDLKLAERDTTGRMAAVAAAALVIAVGAFWWLRRWVRRRGRAPVNRLLDVCAALALAFGLAASTAFVRSPLFDPGEYAVPAAKAAFPNSSQPNVLWVVLDTVRGDHTSLYGYPPATTPRLAEYAKGAIVFERAVSNGIWTLPNHASMFSGRSLRAHGADFRNARLDEEFTTVAEVLRDHGYATAAFSNNPWVAPDTQITRGFDTVRVMYHLRHVTRSSVGWIFERLGLSPPFRWLDEDFGAALTNGLIDEWLNGRATDDQPVFLFVNYMDAHLPYRVPGRYRRMFLSPEQVRRSFAISLSAYGRIVDAVDRRFNFEDQAFFAPADREILKGQYDAGIRYLDDRVSELLAMFRERDMLDNTLVVIVSDHGEYLDQHGQWAHRMQAYQDLLNVVILLRAPGTAAGRRISTPAQLSDLHGTVIAATVGTNGLAAEDAGPGTSRVWPALDLFALASADAGATRIAVSEYNGDSPQNLKRIRDRNDPVLSRRALPQVAAQDARYKLLVTADGTQELFDVVEDPREDHDLLKIFPQHAERLGRYLAEWHERVPAHTPPADADSTGMAPEVIRALKSLGYLGDDD